MHPDFSTLTIYVIFDPDLILLVSQSNRGEKLIDSRVLYHFKIHPNYAEIRNYDYD